MLYFTYLAATATISYNQTLAVTGGTAPFTWSLAAGSQLPTGLSLSSGGTISGTPTIPGNVSFTVQVTDSGTPTAQTTTRGLSILINPPPLSITTSSLPSATATIASGTSASAASSNRRFT